MDYRHMSADEIVSHIRKFGTEAEKLIVDKLRPENPNEDIWDDCPHCDKYALAFEEIDSIIAKVI